MSFCTSHPVRSETPERAQAQSCSTRLFFSLLHARTGDYHHYHSPCEWHAQTLRHFPGDLFSVAPSVAALVKGLFSFNERIVLEGTWQHGFFSYTAVGAYNVGSMTVTCDPELRTNRPGRYKQGDVYCKDLHSSAIPAENIDSEGFRFGKGERVGAFRLGSTVILLFEAPEDFTFSIKNNQKLKYGEPLGSVPLQSN
eukprot:m.63635 g.63635  ORF g.63635 m.63635 type:complete len:197 (-) comp7468_c0_seq3:115-705(-)